MYELTFVSGVGGKVVVMYHDEKAAFKIHKHEIPRYFYETFGTPPDLFVATNSSILRQPMELSQQ